LAIAAPMPAVLPVTSASLPLSSRSIETFLRDSSRFGLASP
jgi:hypothetical protein